MLERIRAMQIYFENNCIDILFEALWPLLPLKGGVTSWETLC